MSWQPQAFPQADYEAYTYDAAGNRLSLRKRDGSAITYEYDALNRMTRKIVPERPAPHPYPLTAAQTRDVFYGYDLRGLQTFARFDSASGEGVTSAYDGFGRLSSSTLVMDGVSRALTHLYDAAGNRTRLTHPDAQAFTFAHDALGRLTAFYQGIGTSIILGQFAYDARGLVASRVDRPGSSVSYGYDPIGRLTSQADTFTGGTGNVTIGRVGAVHRIMAGPGTAAFLASHTPERDIMSSYMPQVYVNIEVEEYSESEDEITDDMDRGFTFYS